MRWFCQPPAYAGTELGITYCFRSALRCVAHACDLYHIFFRLPSYSFFTAFSYVAPREHFRCPLCSLIRRSFILINPAFLNTTHSLLSRISIVSWGIFIVKGLNLYDTTKSQVACNTSVVPLSLKRAV